jgi:EAL domain-containing protein (putative c-di-GMP-specific phosphodiesterase class I)
VGRWALRKAIEDYQRWRNAGFPAVRIAVNVSPLQLRNQNFVAEIQQAVSVAPDAAAGLRLEITESVIKNSRGHAQDRPFIRGRDGCSNRGLTLVSVIINLAHALRLNTVAEGVETEEQLRQLRLLGCDEMQGYLFGKPVPVETFEQQYMSSSVGVCGSAWGIPAADRQLPSYAGRPFAIHSSVLPMASR